MEPEYFKDLVERLMNLRNYVWNYTVSEVNFHEDIEVKIHTIVGSITNGLLMIPPALSCGSDILSMDAKQASIYISDNASDLKMNDIIQKLDKINESLSHDLANLRIPVTYSNVWVERIGTSVNVVDKLNAIIDKCLVFIPRNLNDTSIWFESIGKNNLEMKNYSEFLQEYDYINTMNREGIVEKDGLLYIPPSDGNQLIIISVTGNIDLKTDPEVIDLPDEYNGVNFNKISLYRDSIFLLPQDMLVNKFIVQIYKDPENEWVIRKVIVDILGQSNDWFNGLNAFGDPDLIYSKDSDTYVFIPESCPNIYTFRIVEVDIENPSNVLKTIEIIDTVTNLNLLTSSKFQDSIILGDEKNEMYLLPEDENKIVKIVNHPLDGIDMLTFEILNPVGDICEDSTCIQTFYNKELNSFVSFPAFMFASDSTMSITSLETGEVTNIIVDSPVDDHNDETNEWNFASETYQNSEFGYYLSPELGESEHGLFIKISADLTYEIKVIKSKQPTIGDYKIVRRNPYSDKGFLKLEPLYTSIDKLVDTLIEHFHGLKISSS